MIKKIIFFLFLFCFINCARPKDLNTDEYYSMLVIRNLASNNTNSKSTETTSPPSEGGSSEPVAKQCNVSETTASEVNSMISMSETSLNTVSRVLDGVLYVSLSTRLGLSLSSDLNLDSNDLISLSIYKGDQKCQGDPSDLSEQGSELIGICVFSLTNSACMNTDSQKTNFTIDSEYTFSYSKLNFVESGNYIIVTTLIDAVPNAVGSFYSKISE